MTKNITGILMAIVFFVACNNNDNDNTSLNGSDEQFLLQASYLNHDETFTGHAAAVHGSADSVRLFGQMMVTDHTTAQASLDSLGGQFNIQLPQSADSAHGVFLLQLQSLSGYAFDTTYMGAQVRDHQLAVTVFQNEISNGNNQQTKNYAVKNLPVIQEHLQMAQSILSGLH